MHKYEIGDIAFWSPGPDVAIYYRHGGDSIPDPGIIIIGKIDSGVEALNVDGSVRVTFELSNQSGDQTETGGSALLPVPTLEDLRTVAPAFCEIHGRPSAWRSLEAARAIAARPQHHYRGGLDRPKPGDRNAIPFQPGA